MDAPGWLIWLALGFGFFGGVMAEKLQRMVNDARNRRN
jgi:hypothetical protein